MTPGGPYTTIAPNISATTFTDTQVTRGTPYYYVVSGVNSSGEGYNSGETAASAGLPAPWSNQDIGTVVLPGTSTRTPTGFRLTASGATIGGTSDSFQYAYVPVTGDTTIIAHVAGMMNTLGQDRAGVMMRETLDPTSKFAAILIEDDGNLRLTRRTTTGGTAGTSGSVNGTFWAPGWIKLERIGNTFNAYLSTDGVDWGSAFTTQTLTMNSTFYVGLATTSRVTYQTIVSNFDNVQILPRRDRLFCVLSNRRAARHDQIHLHQRRQRHAKRWRPDLHQDSTAAPCPRCSR